MAPPAPPNKPKALPKKNIAEQTQSVSARAQPLFPFAFAGAGEDAVASMGGGAGNVQREKAAWQQWVDWKTSGTGIFTLELALPHLLRGALLIQGGWNAPTSLDVVLRHLQDDAWANAEALQDDAWAVATAAAESGHVDYDDVGEWGESGEWAAATAAAMRRVAHG